MTNGKIVTIGGGHGTATLVEHLKLLASDLTSIVTVFDNGGDTGRLRRIQNIAAVGDARRVVAALIPDQNKLLKELIALRFELSDDGHQASVGNIITAAFLRLNGGDLAAAFHSLSELFRAGHRVLPISNDNVHLCARMSDGSMLEGEEVIDTRFKDKKNISLDHRQILDVVLKPSAGILPAAAAAIRTADKVVFCPGSFWTSLVCNFVVCGFAEVIQESRAQMIYVMNLMTNHNETPGWKGSDHAREVAKKIGRPIDTIVCNEGPIPQRLLLKYFNEDSVPVDIDPDLRNFGRVKSRDLIDCSGGVIRHSKKLAEVVASL